MSTEASTEANAEVSALPERADASVDANPPSADEEMGSAEADCAAAAADEGQLDINEI